MKPKKSATAAPKRKPSERRATPEERKIDLAIGGVIRAERKARGLTMNTLGDRARITFQQVQKYEKGVNRVSVSRLFSFASGLGIAPADLFAKIESARP